MSTTPDSFHRTEDFEARIDSVLLPDEAWAVFAQLEKAATAADVAATTGMDIAVVQTQIDLLVQNKLVRKKLVNWRDFLAQKGISTGPTRMSPAGPQPAPAVLASQARKPVAPPPAAAPAPASTTAPVAAPLTSAPRATTPPLRVAPKVASVEPVDPEGTITFRLCNEPARRTRRAGLAMCITFRLGAATEPETIRTAPAARPVSAVRTAPPPAPEPEPVFAAVPEPALVATADDAPAATAVAPAVAAVSTFAPRKLRRLIDAITVKGGGGLQGQLLVYRVFLRVPPALMFAAGIKSLNLIDDSIELQDERTYDAIRSAARSVASLELDEIAA